METFWTILWIVGVSVALFLFYCGGWWPRTWFRGFLFVLLSFALLPIITFPIQWWVWKYCHNGIIEGSGGGITILMKVLQPIIDLAKQIQ